jgi:hypothetical protein
MLPKRTDKNGAGELAERFLDAPSEYRVTKRSGRLWLVR